MISRSLAMQVIEKRRISLYRRPDHIAIGPVDYDDVNSIFTAPLLIRHEHPYFFDHPLDHVPGVLLLEGIFQLFFTAIAMATKVALAEGKELYLKKVEISFPYWCEKDLPARVELIPKFPLSSMDSHLVYQGKVVQDGHSTCIANLEGAWANARFEMNPLGLILESTSRPKPKPNLLHKQQEENVLISLLDSESGGGCCCSLIRPFDNHIFADWDSSFHSMLYLLEATRQFAMLMAHMIEGMPLDLPIILISLSFSLHGPVHRQAPLELSSTRRSILKFADKAISTIDITLHGLNGPLGEGSIRSMVVDKRVYQKKRWRR